MHGPEKYVGKDCGDPRNINGVAKLELRYTEKPGLFSLGSPWCELTCANGNVGFYNIPERVLVSRYGRYHTEIVKNNEVSYEHNHLTMLNGQPIIRGLPLKPEKWWHMTKREYYDFNERKYHLDISYAKGLLKSMYYVWKDSEGNTIMHLGAEGPYKPVSFDFFLSSERSTDETSHALLYMLIKLYYEQQSSSV